MTTETREKFLKILEEVKMQSKNHDRQTAWVKKILDNPDKHFDIVVRFAEEAKKRLGSKLDD
jgi:hypothetical protein